MLQVLQLGVMHVAVMCQYTRDSDIMHEHVPNVAAASMHVAVICWHEGLLL